MQRLGLVNAYGPGGFILTMPLSAFLSAATPAIKAADDAPPSGKPPTPVTFPTPYARAGMVPVERWTPPAVGGPPTLDMARRPGKF